MKYAVVTGASRGLGAEIYSALTKLGFSVRTPTREALDLSSPDSIMAYFPDVQHLDLLVNNAAVLGETVEEAMAINAMGAYYLSCRLWPILRQGKGRIINISSREGLGRDGCLRPYSVSKATLNALTRMQAHNTDGITVTACCPGWFKSRLGGDKAPRTAAEAADTPVWLATEAEGTNGKFYIDRKEVAW